MIEIGQSVIVRNNEKQIFEMGTAQSSYRRDKIQRYVVKLERGVEMDLSCDPRQTFYLDLDKTEKYSKRKIETDAT